MQKSRGELVFFNFHTRPFNKFQIFDPSNKFIYKIENNIMKSYHLLYPKDSDNIICLGMGKRCRIKANS